MDGQQGMPLVFSPHFSSPEGYSFSSQIGFDFFFSFIDIEFSVKFFTL